MVNVYYIKKYFFMQHIKNYIIFILKYIKIINYINNYMKLIN